MSTSSITKDFYVKDQKIFEQLKKQLDGCATSRRVDESTSLKRGREKLAIFVFR